MQFHFCVFLLCAFVLVSWINAEPYDYNPYNYYQRPNNFARFGGNSFGEGVLRPGSDTAGEGIFTERDAPILTAPSNDRYNIYG